MTDTVARRTLTLVVGGAAQVGKSALLEALRQRVPVPETATSPERWYQGPLLDWLALDLGHVGGVDLEVHLYVVPVGGQNDPTRRMILTRADGLLFVVDSQAHRLDDNIRALVSLWGRGLGTAPQEGQAVSTVFFHAKQDLPRELILPAETLDEMLHQGTRPGIAGDALRGTGVLEALKLLLTSVLDPGPTGE